MPNKANENTVLAIGAHPDDVELGAGATLSRLQSQGWRVVIFVATKGSLCGDTEVRRQEQEEAARFLGAEVCWGSLQDGHIQAIPETVQFIETLVKTFSPTLVFVHWREDTHQDHRNLSLATVSAVRKVPNLIFYEGPTSERFDPVVFVHLDSSAFDRKSRLVNYHFSQMHKNGQRYQEWMTLTAESRALKCGSKYCEAFVPARIALFLQCLPRIDMLQSVSDHSMQVNPSEKTPAREATWQRALSAKSRYYSHWQLDHTFANIKEIADSCPKCKSAVICCYSDQGQSDPYPTWAHACLNPGCEYCEETTERWDIFQSTPLPNCYYCGREVPF